MAAEPAPLLLEAHTDHERRVDIPLANGPPLTGFLAPPTRRDAVCVFVHDSRTSRHCPRNQRLAAGVRDAGLGTLIVDLLTRADPRPIDDYVHVRILAERLLAVTDWLGRQPETRGVPVTCFASSAGARAAFMAAREAPDEIVALTVVGAVVPESGTPSVCDAVLPAVQAPTLFLVGQSDAAGIERHRRAAALTSGPAEVFVIAGSGHLLERLDALDEAAGVAAEWFDRQVLRRRTWW